jgi:hypothetical protein
MEQKSVPLLYILYHVRHKLWTAYQYVLWSLSVKSLSFLFPLLTLSFLALPLRGSVVTNSLGDYFPAWCLVCFIWCLTLNYVWGQLGSGHWVLVSAVRYCISRPIRRTFSPEKKSYTPRVSIISKLINSHTSIIQYLYLEIVKSASKSDLASLLVNGLLSYLGIYPNIASHVIPGIYIAAAAKCSRV